VLIPNGRAPWTCDVGTIIKAAKTAGFALGPAKVLATASASSFISYGPFTMTPSMASRSWSSLGGPRTRSLSQLGSAHRSRCWANAVTRRGARGASR
jgi:hypothetical protein